MAVVQKIPAIAKHQNRPNSNSNQKADNMNSFAQKCLLQHSPCFSYGIIPMDSSLLLLSSSRHPHALFLTPNDLFT